MATLTQQIEQILNENKNALTVQTNIKYPLFNTNFDVEITIENVGKATIKAYVDNQFDIFIEDGHQCASSENEELAEVITAAINEETMLLDAIFDELDSDKIQEKFAQVAEELEWEADDFELTEGGQCVTLICKENKSCFYNVTVQLPDTPDSMEWVDNEEAKGEFAYKLVNLAIDKIYDHFGEGDHQKAKMAFVCQKEVIDYKHGEMKFQYFQENEESGDYEKIEFKEYITYAYHSEDKEDFTILVDSSIYDTCTYMTLGDYLNANNHVSILENDE